MLRTLAYGSALAAAVFGGSIEDCGKSGDMMSNVQISLSPDPPSANRDFTLTMNGDLGEDLTGGALTAHMTISVLGNDIKIDSTTMFHLSPGIPKGAQAIKLGPFKYPKLPLGVKPIINGNLTISDSSSKQVSCLKFNKFPVMTAAPVKEIVKDDPVTICSAASDHLKDIKFSSANGITTINGTMDEDVTSGELDIDMKISVNLFADISIDLNIDTPFSYTPGIKKGPLSVRLGPSRTLVNGEPSSVGAGAISATVKGTIKAKDSSGGEIVCVKIDVEPSTQTTAITM